MSVNISIYGSDVESYEYYMAEQLKDIIINDIPSSVEGKISLIVNATLFGQEVKDIDIIMIGELVNYNLELHFSDRNNSFVNDIVDIKKFCTTIEIKKHDICNIFRRGTDFYVLYGHNEHCVTLQSNKQKYATKNYLERILGISPYITNLIWFTQATDNDINSLQIQDNKKIISNILGNRFCFSDLIQLLIYQNPPYNQNGRYVFGDSTQNLDDIRKALSFFEVCQQAMGELTRKRIEQITKEHLCNDFQILENNKISIYRGRAGTGKTTGLIQLAIKLVEEKDARVIILTYNKALVSDIRRLFSFAEMPDMFEDSCVEISTMHSYFFKLANKLLYSNNLKGDKFIEKYNFVLEELNHLLNSSNKLEEAKEKLNNSFDTNWEYVLIDEAQDWNVLEQDIILKLFEKNKIIVADGGLQFVRKVNRCKWTEVRDKNMIKLKYCLRQKENLIEFINILTNKFGAKGSKILSKNNMLGGKVLIVNNSNLFNIHYAEMENMKNAKNVPYDMLYLVPNDLVRKEYGSNKFAKKDLFNENGIFFWDGTNSKNRDSFPIEIDEVRLIQYESARGLEAWTVFCIDFDVFIEEKKCSYEEGEVNRLILESPQERKKKYIYNWILIALTRAIDTIVITLRDQNSEIAQLLKEIANEHSDFVSYM